MKQMELFDQKLKSLVTTARELTQPRVFESELLPENDIAACYAVANACKKSIHRSGHSRAQMVDQINKYWSRSDEGADSDPPECLKPLSKSMLDNYLSKPSQYRIPAIYVIAIESITKNLEISRVFVDAQGGQVINANEAQQLKLAQVQHAMNKLAKHEKELKKLAGY